MPRSDLVLFVMSADRPFTESEVKFLRYIRQWGKKVVFVLNKVRCMITPAFGCACGRCRRGRLLACCACCQPHAVTQLSTFSSASGMHSAGGQPQQ